MVSDDWRRSWLWRLAVELLESGDLLEQRNIDQGPGQLLIRLTITDAQITGPPLSLHGFHEERPGIDSASKARRMRGSTVVVADLSPSLSDQQSVSGPLKLIKAVQNSGFFHFGEFPHHETV